MKVGLMFSIFPMHPDPCWECEASTMIQYFASISVSNPVS